MGGWLVGGCFPLPGNCKIVVYHVVRRGQNYKQPLYHIIQVTHEILVAEALWYIQQGAKEKVDS